MAKWQYMFPTRADVPVRLQDKRLPARDAQQGSRLAIYCAAKSHRDEPWLLGSFTPSVAVYEDRGEVVFNWTGNYPAGDGWLFRVAGAGEQLIADGQPVPQGDDGHLITTEAHAQGYGRVPLKCGECGLRRVYRAENIQETVARFLDAGFREIDLSTFAKAVDSF